MVEGKGEAFTIITPTYNDVWGLTKTMASVLTQTNPSLEYIIVDGAMSSDVAAIVSFWEAMSGRITLIQEADAGVYDAMNKGVTRSSGDFVCFMNSGDRFSKSTVLDLAHDTLYKDDKADGLIGWGRLGGQIWATWTTRTSAVRMASLGFCHQALFMGRRWLECIGFDARRGRTDSDTLQMSQAIASGARIKILRDVLAVRSTAPGISSDLQKTAQSIKSTLCENYSDISDHMAEAILNFRRRCENTDQVLDLMSRGGGETRLHISMMVLDTLYQKPSKCLSSETASELAAAALDEVMDSGVYDYFSLEDELIESQKARGRMMAQHRAQSTARVDRATAIEAKLERKGVLVPLNECGPNPSSHFVVVMTSFPERLDTLHLVLRSLLSQTIRPREIRLVLGRDEVPSDGHIPRSIRRLQEYGVTIQMVSQTYHQYDKFFHCSKLNEEFPLVLVDDDIVYRRDSLEKLWLGAQRYEECIIANRCHEITLRDNGTLTPYAEWPQEIQSDRPMHRLFPTGAGGVWYPQGWFQREHVLNRTKVLRNAPYADDIWLKGMSLLHGTPVVSTELSCKHGWYVQYTPSMKVGALHSNNVDLGLNDAQLNNTVSFIEALGCDWRALLSETRLR